MDSLPIEIMEHMLQFAIYQDTPTRIAVIFTCVEWCCILHGRIFVPRERNITHAECTADVADVAGDVAADANKVVAADADIVYKREYLETIWCEVLCSGRTKVFIWLHEIGLKFGNRNICALCSQYDNMQCLQYAHEHGHEMGRSVSN